MATCPNCGEIVMNGDPYCTNCGATLKWNFDDDEDYYEKDSSPDLNKVFEIMVNSNLTTREKFDLFKKYLFLTDYMYDGIMESILQEEKLHNCNFVMVYTKPYPPVYIFFRQDKYRDVLIFERCYVEYQPTLFDPELEEFHYSYEKLLNNPKFKSEVERIEREGLKFKEISSDITTPIWENVFTVNFKDSDDNLVIYKLEEDLNLIKLV